VFIRAREMGEGCKEKMWRSGFALSTPLYGNHCITISFATSENVNHKSLRALQVKHDATFL